MKWYYASEGQQVGPITTEQLKYLASSGAITPQTLVWRQGFGEEWRPAAQAGIIFIGHPAAANTDVKPLHDTWVWVFLVVPWALGQLFTAWSMLHAWSDKMMAAASVPLSLIGLGVAIVAFILDRSVLREAGYRPPSAWWILLTPGYCWARMRVVGRGKIVLWVSLLLMVISFGSSLYRYQHMAHFKASVTHSASGHDDGTDGAAGGDDQENL